MSHQGQRLLRSRPSPCSSPAGDIDDLAWLSSLSGRGTPVPPDGGFDRPPADRAGNRNPWGKRPRGKRRLNVDEATEWAGCGSDYSVIDKAIWRQIAKAAVRC